MLHELTERIIILPGLCLKNLWRRQLVRNFPHAHTVLTLNAGLQLCFLITEELIMVYLQLFFAEYLLSEF